MQFRDHPGVQGKRDAYPFDPRMLKIDAGYNIRDLDSPEEREELDTLKEMIRSNGVKTPLEVRLRDDDVIIVAGHRRHRAVMELIAEGEDIKSVPVLPEAKGTSEADRVVNLVLSNSGKPLKPLQTAEVVRRLVAFGWDKTQIAQRLGWKSVATVAQHLDMLAMPEAVKNHVRQGEISATTARRLAKSELSPEEQEELIKSNIAENKRIAPKGRSTKVTAKTLKRDKAKAKPKFVGPSGETLEHDPGDGTNMNFGTKGGGQNVNGEPKIASAAEPNPVPDAARPLSEIMGLPDEAGEQDTTQSPIAMESRAPDADECQTAFLTAVHSLVDRTRDAVSYHYIGYNSPNEFEANEMLARMDKLAEALAAFDEAEAAAGVAR